MVNFMELNTSDWKEFKYSKIFDIRNGFYNKKPDHREPGTIPFLGAIDKNNGVSEYYTLQEIKSSSKTGDDNNAPLSEKIFPAHSVCVTNNGSVGYAYYQDKEFTCSHDVNPLYIKNGEFNLFTGLFVATVIEMDKYRWQYGRKWRPSRMKNSVIKLPAQDDGSPDWTYMEKYMRTLLPIDKDANDNEVFNLRINI